jgi:hypothetical protein
LITNLPNNFEQAQFQSIAALCPDTQIRKDKETGVFVVMLGVFEVIEGRDDRASRASRATILMGRERKINGVERQEKT